MMNIKGYVESKRKYLNSKRKIYPPLYNYYVGINSEYIPKVYNYEGRQYDFFFLRDIHSAHAPYEGTGKYFIYDRYNYGLKTHFYSHLAMLETMGKPVNKYGMLPESRAIVPRDFEIFRKHKGLEKEFDAIFTCDDYILNEIENALFLPFGARIWYREANLDMILDDQYKRKTENISIISSDKVWCELHKVRLELARKCKRNNLATTFGTFEGGEWTSYDVALEKFKYSIVIENYISDYFFTERITSCFAAQTIPIYLGARKIYEFFNPEGIVTLTMNKIEHIEDVLKECTEGYYLAHLDAIKENYYKSLEYLNMQDYLYEHYLAK